ncbi:MAG TPA: hypothetical protein VNT33_09600, partial [Telluria sp.]|nr:hypothetical protein [Telluria sp.]
MFQLLPAVGRVIAYAAFFALSMNAHADAGAASWVLSYQNKSTNEFIWDKRTESLVRRTLPPRFSRLVLGALGGPPDPVIVTAGRFASMSACRAHSCIEKGFFWVDSATGDALGGYFLDGSLLLGSNAFTRSSIPAA